jgi:hypothetical protein
MGELEADMVDEMMQAALNLDVEREIQNKLNKAKAAIDVDRIDESRRSNTLSISHRSAKKKVIFRSPDHSPRQSSHHHDSKGESEESPSRRDSYTDSHGDMISESIKIEESIGQSSMTSGKRGSKSGKLHDSSGKLSNRSKGKGVKKILSEQIDEIGEEDDSLERDEPDDYSEDFYQSSVKAKTQQSAKSKQTRSVEESNMYSESFEDPS